MPLDEPPWWYGAAAPATVSLLRPVAWVAGAIAQRRWRRATPYRSTLPVICIGNFTAGGTGKTPLALEVGRILRELGEAPVYLSRGYGGTDRGPRAVDAASDRASVTGDEPLLLACTAPAFVSRDRMAGAKAIEAAIAAGHQAGTVIVMDDGLQNPQLAKALTIAVVDGLRGFGNGQVIPAGPLRAPLAFQMTLADAIVVNGGTGLDVANTFAPTLRRQFSGPVLQASVKPEGGCAWLKEKPVVAFAGIGNPKRFFDLVTSLGGTIAETVTFADHQALREADALRVLDAARRHGAQIVTTVKDIARLSGTTGTGAQLREAARALPIRLSFADEDEQRLIALLRAALAKPR
jgi:tetraacyldisaccharide 4'-kinase